MTSSPSNARFSWQKSRWTGSASVSGGTQGATGYPWRMPAENSTRETQPSETRGRRGWIDIMSIDVGALQLQGLSRRNDIDKLQNNVRVRLSNHDWVLSKLARRRIDPQMRFPLCVAIMKLDILGHRRFVYGSNSSTLMAWRRKNRGALMLWF